MAIELTDLRVFLAVVEHGSFSRAASALVMTQPSVSERVAGLERSVGTALFDRSTRGAVATAAGTRFAARARRCVELADEAVADALEEARTPRLRVAVHGAFAARAVPLVTEVADALDCRLDVRDVHTDEAQHLVLDQLADVGFVAPGPAPRGLAVLALPADPVVCVVHPAHPLASRPALRVVDLAGATVALNAWGDGATAFVRALEAAPIRPSALRHLSDARAAALLALDHAHVAVVTRSTVAHELGSGTLVALSVRDLGRWDVPVALTYRAARAKEPVVRAVIDAARRQARRRRSS